MTWHLPFVVLLALDAAAIVALYRFAMFAPLKP